MISRIFILITLICFSFSAEKKSIVEYGEVENYNYFLNRDIQNSPNLDRAKGFLLKGEVKAAISNYGSFISWGFQPNGLWGQYSYIPDLSFKFEYDTSDYSRVEGKRVKFNQDSE